uniref:Fork-head domain-containing protein n=1 Tax=Heterorhabditis bacteriophora TaxID=37862 RepID=A0A1I7XFV4_HETBA
MDDVGSLYGGGLSMLLSAVAQPLTLDDNEFSLDWGLKEVKREIKEEPIDHSCANSPSSLLSLEDESSHSSFSSISSFNCDLSSTSFSAYDLLGLPDPTITVPLKEEKPVVVRRPVMVRKRMRECSMVCWLFRTLLTSEYRALPLNAIFEIFEDTNPSSAHGRHWRQSIRHCLMSSAVFVRVLTPNPRKDFLVMNEAGSWWTVHPECETACAEDVFRPGLAHRCPPNGGGGVVRMKMYRVDDTSEIIYRDSLRGKWMGDKIFAKRKPLQERPKKRQTMSHSSLIFSNNSSVLVNPSSGDHLVVDHEEEKITLNFLAMNIFLKDVVDP